MTLEELKKANEIKDEIEKLKQFLLVAEKVWTGRLVKRTSNFIIKSNPYGVFEEAEYHLDTKTKNIMLSVLKDKLEDLKRQLGDI